MYCLRKCAAVHPCCADSVASYLQERNEIVACCKRQRQTSLLEVSMAAFNDNRDWQMAKRQAAQQAHALMKRRLLKTVLVAWRMRLQVISLSISD